MPEACTDSPCEDCPLGNPEVRANLPGEDVRRIREAPHPCHVTHNHPTPTRTCRGVELLLEEREDS